MLTQYKLSRSACGNSVASVMSWVHLRLHFTCNIRHFVVKLQLLHRSYIIVVTLANTSQLLHLWLHCFCYVLVTMYSYSVTLQLLHLHLPFTSYICAYMYISVTFIMDLSFHFAFSYSNIQLLYIMTRFFSSHFLLLNHREMSRYCCDCMAAITEFQL